MYKLYNCQLELSEIAYVDLSIYLSIYLSIWI